MASFAAIIPIVLFLLLLNQGEANNVLSTICPKTIDPSFCYKTIQSEPRIATTDLPGLASIIVELAQKKATTTLDLLTNSLTKQPNIDHVLKQNYEKCTNFYNQSIGNLNKAKQNADSRNYKLLSDVANYALESIESCEDSLKGSQASPELSMSNQYTLKLCNMVFTCADQLLS